jgi:hypothetical protein
MHTSKMLSEEVLSIEFSGLTLPTSVVLPAGPEIADPCCEIKVLGGDMTFPFVLTGEGSVATCKVEDADKCTSMGRGDVTLEGCRIFEWRMVALFAIKVATGFRWRFVNSATLDGVVLGRDFWIASFSGTGAFWRIFLIRYRLWNCFNILL